MSGRDSILSAQDVWAGYGSQPVLAGIDLTLQPGDALGIIGRSGVGKSTLVDVLLGTLKPTQGRVTFDSRAVARLSRKETKSFRTIVRVVHQNGMVGVDPRHTVDKVLSGALDDARRAGRATGRTTADVLDLVALEQRLSGRTVSSLSGGERQRVALARALSTRPDLLILDEPLTALDPALREQVTQTVTELVAREGVGVLVVSHDLRLVERLARSVHVLAEGRLVESGTLREVLAHPQHPDTKELAAALPEAVGAFR
ncbi:ABC transporter ATP-binding protein [Cellulomonas hominis]